MAKSTSKKKTPAAKKPTAGKKSKTTKATRKPAQQRASTGKNAKPSRPAAQPPKKSTAKPQPSKANTPTGKTRKISEFRYPKQQGSHPMYIYKVQDGEAVGLGITHDAGNSNRSKTRKLEKNPNPNDPRPSKIKKKAERVKKQKLGPRLKGWGFQTKKDRETVNELIKENNKNGN